jgi:hypothetical protein
MHEVVHGVPISAHVLCGEFCYRDSVRALPMEDYQTHVHITHNVSSENINTVI